MTKPMPRPPRSQVRHAYAEYGRKKKAYQAAGRRLRRTTGRGRTAARKDYTSARRSYRAAGRRARSLGERAKR